MRHNRKLWRKSGAFFVPIVVCYNGRMETEQLTLMIWETSRGPKIEARKPVFTLSVERAAKILGVSKDVVQRLCKAGMLRCSKPGGWRQRKDGKPTNAKYVVCAESVLSYKKAITVEGVY
jgi:excisionase family DNA binding protein